MNHNRNPPDRGPGLREWIAIPGEFSWYGYRTIGSSIGKNLDHIAGPRTRTPTRLNPASPNRPPSLKHLACPDHLDSPYRSPCLNRPARLSHPACLEGPNRSRQGLNRLLQPGADPRRDQGPAPPPRDLPARARRGTRAAQARHAPPITPGRHPRGPQKEHLPGDLGDPAAGHGPCRPDPPPEFPGGVRADARHLRTSQGHGTAAVGWSIERLEHDGLRRRGVS